MKVARSFTGQYLAPLLRGRDGKVVGKREAVAAEGVSSALTVGPGP